METTNYKKGDVVLLNDGYRYEYLGEVLLSGGRTSHAYRPLDGKTEYATTKNDAGEFVPFPLRYPRGGRRERAQQVITVVPRVQPLETLPLRNPSGRNKLLARYRTSSRNGIQRCAARR